MNVTTDMTELNQVKFIISGEPFIITKDILDRFPETILHNAISFNKNKGGIDSKINESEIVVEFHNRDIKSFRCIRSYMETGIPILISDPIEKEILLRELIFYGFTDYVKFIKDTKSIAEISAELNKEPHDTQNRVHTGQLSIEFLKKYNVINIYELQNSSPGLSDILCSPINNSEVKINTVDLDKRIKSEELLSRIKFGAKINASDTVKLVQLFDIKRTRADCPDYKFLKYPRAKLDEKYTPKLVDDLIEFKQQFNLVSMKLLNEIFDLPFVIAGGSVLFSLMRFHQYNCSSDLYSKVHDQTSHHDPILEFAKIYAESSPHNVHNQVPDIKEFKGYDKFGNCKISDSNESIIKTLMYLNNVCWIASHDKFKKIEGSIEDKFVGLKREDDLLASYKSTDIDLFIITRDPEKAVEAILELHKRIKKKTDHITFNVIRTQNSITFDLPRPYRRIQIILRLYHSIQHVLMGFDVDCCCVGYDGKSVVATERGARAIQYQYNLVDTTRLSTTYENRMIKYAKRGFLIAMDRSVDLDIQMKLVKEKIATKYLIKDYINLHGIQLLLAKLYSIVTGNNNLKKWLNVRTSDYGINFILGDYKYSSYYKTTGRTNCALNEDIYKALFSSLAVSKNWRGVVETYKSTVPEYVTFQTELPHVQDRVDILYTGSFEPICVDDWYNPKC